MTNDRGLTEASQQYTEAQAAQYETKDLQEALGLYERVVAAHPETEEAGYSRSQIQNIVKRVVPEPELVEAHLKMAMAHLGGDRRHGNERTVASILEAKA